MNIFFLDYDLKKCAQYHTDTHAIKIVLEAAQLLAAAYPNGAAPYKRTHSNHPMSVWVRDSLDNFLWTIDYGKALANEYTYRYGKRHKTEAVLDWYADNIPEFTQDNHTEPPRCFGQSSGIVPTTSCIVTDYRNYYKASKQHLFKWKKRDKPEWLIN